MHAPDNIRRELTEPYFRRFESVIQSAVLSFPSPIEVHWRDSGLRFHTFLSRLRDAIRSFRTYHWSTTWFNPSLHSAALAALEVRPHPQFSDRVIIGIRGAGVLSHSGSTSSSLTFPTPLIITQSTGGSTPATQFLSAAQVGAAPSPSTPQSQPAAPLGTASTGLSIPLALQPSAHARDTWIGLLRSYAEVVSNFSNCPRLTVQKSGMSDADKEVFGEHLKWLEGEFDIAVSEQDDHWLVI